MKTISQLNNEMQTVFVFFGLAAIFFPETVLLSCSSFSDNKINVLKMGVRLIGIVVASLGIYYFLYSTNGYQAGSKVLLCLSVVLFGFLKFKLKLK